MNFNSLLTVLSLYWWSSNPAAKPIKTQQNRTTRRSIRSPPTDGVDLKGQESYQQPMYNDEQTYNPIYSPAMSSSPATIVNQQQQPLVIITSPVDCCSRMTTQMKKVRKSIQFKKKKKKK